MAPGRADAAPPEGEARRRAEPQVPQHQPPERQPPEDEGTLETTVRGQASLDEASTASESRVDRATLRALPQRSADLTLGLAPGVVVIQHGAEGKGAQLLLRGFDASHGSDVEVLLDGIPLNEPSHVHGHGYLDLAFLPAAALRDVEVVAGPFDPAQGDFATAGTVHLRTGVIDAERGTRLGATYGSTDRYELRATWAPRWAATSSYVAAEAVADDGFGAGRHSERAAVLGRWTLLDPSRWDHGTLRVVALAHHGRFGNPGALPRADVLAGTDPFASYTPTAGGRSTRGLVGVSHRILLGGGVLHGAAYGGWRRFELRENYTGWLQDPAAGDGRAQRQETTTLGGRLRYQRALPAPDDLSLVLDAGLDWRTDVATQRETHANGARTRDLPFTQTGLGLYAGLSLDWGPLHARGGVRGAAWIYDLRPSLDAPTGALELRGTAAPRVSLRWDLREDLALFAAYGRGLRPAEARAVTPGPAGAGALPADVTVTDTGELGVRLALGPWLSLSVAGFTTYVEHESIFDHLTGTNVTLGSSLRAGVDATATVGTPWLPGVSLRLDATAVHAGLVDGGGPIRGVPRWSGAAALLFERRGFDGGLRVVALGQRPIGADLEAPPLALISGSVGYRHGWLWVGFSVENLLDTRWREAELLFGSRWDRRAPVSLLPQVHWIYGPPRMFRVGLEVSL